VDGHDKLMEIASATGCTDLYGNHTYHRR
jgi:hypothetical protein